MKKRDVLALIKERGASRGDWLISIGGVDRIRYPETGNTQAVISWDIAYAVLEELLPPLPEKVSLEGLSQVEREKVVLSMMKKGEPK